MRSAILLLFAHKKLLQKHHVSIVVRFSDFFSRFPPIRSLHSNVSIQNQITKRSQGTRQFNNHILHPSLTLSFSLSLSHSRFLTLSFSLCLSHSLSHSIYLSLSFSLSLSHSLFLTLSFSLSLSHSLFLTLSFSHTLSLSLSPSLFLSLPQFLLSLSL